MKHITVLLALVMTAGGLSACDAVTTAEAKPIASPSAALPPAEALLAAVEALDKAAYNFDIKQGTKTGGGRIDPGARTATMSLGGRVQNIDISVAYTIMTPELWVKADFGKDLNKLWNLNPATWMAIDRSKVASTATLPIDDAGAPQLGVIEMCKKGLTDVKRTDATHYAGTVDVTAADSVLAPSDDIVKKAGAKAKAVPFTATTDDQGRLTTFTVDGDAIDPELTLHLTFAGFGSILPVTKPTGAIPAPDSVYDLFN